MVDPFITTLRGDMRSGLVGSILANANRDPKTRPITVTDLLMGVHAESGRITDPEEIRTRLIAMARKHG